MQLWKLVDTIQLAACVQRHGLGQNELFWAVAQAIVEIAEPQTRERTVLEAVVAWGRGEGETLPAQLSFGAA
jgi:hypothetical protein